MAIALAIACAILLGASDNSAARASRSESGISVARTALLTSSLLSPLLLLLQRSEWQSHDVALSAVSGVTLGLGLGLLYLGYATAPIGIVAPTASVLLAAVPVVYDLSTGASLRWTALVGMALGLAALVLTTYVPGTPGNVRTGFLLGVSAGVLFGTAFTTLAKTSDDAGLSPVVIQRSVAFGVLCLLMLDRRRSQPLLVRLPPAVWTAALAGALGTAALACLTLAYRKGSIGPVSVATSQFATAAVIISVIINHDRLRWWQTLGVAVSAVAVAFMAWP